MDFFVKLTQALGGQVAAAALSAYSWLPDAIGYTIVYLFMLFYMRTTFEPLATYGYRWSKDYVLWSLYIGIASGVIIFFVDYQAGLDKLHVPGFSFAVLIGYVISWALLPALVEETLFRGVIQGYFAKHLKREFTSQRIHAAVFVAVGFELLFHIVFPIYYGMTTTDPVSGSLVLDPSLHRMWLNVVSTLPQLIYVLVFGIISGIIYQRTKSLVGPMLMHALGNFVELILIWLLR